METFLPGSFLYWFSTHSHRVNVIIKFSMQKKVKTLIICNFPFPVTNVNHDVCPHCMDGESLGSTQTSVGNQICLMKRLWCGPRLSVQFFCCRWTYEQRLIIFKVLSIQKVNTWSNWLGRKLGCDLESILLGICQPSLAALTSSHKWVCEVCMSSVWVL